jgi:hypothetical protein
MTISHLSGLWFDIPAAVLLLATYTVIFACCKAAAYADRLAGKQGQK